MSINNGEKWYEGNCFKGKKINNLSYDTKLMPPTIDNGASPILKGGVEYVEQ